MDKYSPWKEGGVLLAGIEEGGQTGVAMFSCHFLDWTIMCW